MLEKIYLKMVMPNEGECLSGITTNDKTDIVVIGLTEEHII